MPLRWWQRELAVAEHARVIYPDPDGPPLNLDEFARTVFGGPIAEVIVDQTTAIEYVLDRLTKRCGRPLVQLERAKASIAAGLAWQLHARDLTPPADPVTSAFPHTMHDAEVLAEHAAGEARVVAEASAPVINLPTERTNVSLAAAIGAIRAAHACTECGKSRALINAAAFTRRGGNLPERVNPKVHCACPGGPAYVGPVDRATEPVS